MPMILYWIGGLLWGVEMIPQLYKIYKRKSVKDISIWFPGICIVSFICVFLAHITLKRWMLLLSQTPPLICNVIFLYQVILYRRNDEVNRIPERRLESKCKVEQKGNVEGNS